MPFTLTRQYIDWEGSWWRFCGVYETREEANKAIEIIKDGEYDEKCETDYASFFIYESDVNELIYMSGGRELEPKWWVKK